MDSCVEVKGGMSIPFIRKRRRTVWLNDTEDVTTTHRQWSAVVSQANGEALGAADPP